MQVPSALVTFRFRLVSPPAQLLDRAGVACGRRYRVEQALHLGLRHLRERRARLRATGRS